MTIAVVVLSLGLLAAPGFAAQGTTSGAGTSAERTTTATGAVTDSWLTFKTKLALLADERVSGNDVSVKTVKGVTTLRGKVASRACNRRLPPRREEPLLRRGAPGLARGGALRRQRSQPFRSFGFDATAPRL